MTTPKTFDEAQELFDSVLPKGGSDGETVWVDTEAFNKVFSRDNYWIETNVGDVTGEWGSKYIDHDGWYTDDFQSGSMAGFIVEITLDDEVEDEDGYIEEDATVVYAAGAKATDWDGNSVLPNLYGDVQDAVFAADGLAERMAEDERGHQEAHHKGREASSTLKEGRVKIERAIAMIREGAGNSPTAQTVIADLIDSGKELRQEGWKIVDEYGPSYSYWDDESKHRADSLKESWSEGFQSGLDW